MAGSVSASNERATRQNFIDICKDEYAQQVLVLCEVTYFTKEVRVVKVGEENLKDKVVRHQEAEIFRGGKGTKGHAEMLLHAYLEKHPDLMRATSIDLALMQNYSPCSKCAELIKKFKKKMEGWGKEVTINMKYVFEFVSEKKKEAEANKQGLADLQADGVQVHQATLATIQAEPNFINAWELIEAELDSKQHGQDIQTPQPSPSNDFVPEENTPELEDDSSDKTLNSPFKKLSVETNKTIIVLD